MSEDIGTVEALERLSRAAEELAGEIRGLREDIKSRDLVEAYTRARAHIPGVHMYGNVFTGNIEDYEKINPETGDLI